MVVEARAHEAEQVQPQLRMKAVVSREEAAGSDGGWYLRCVPPRQLRVELRQLGRRAIEERSRCEERAVLEGQRVVDPSGRREGGFGCLDASLCELEVRNQDVTASSPLAGSADPS